jgi:Zn-dependent protease
MIWILIFIVLIFSAVFHEYAHGMAAYSLGDPTAKNMGRLTLNPIPHIDPFFTIILPLLMIILPTNFIIGGAKPVPINPYNLRGKYADMKVALAGPASNLLLAVIFGMFIRFVPAIQNSETLFFAFGTVVFINLLLAVFNLLPIPPLDGSHVLFNFIPFSSEIKAFFSQYGFFILIGILVFFMEYVFSLIFFVISFLFDPITGTSLVDFFNILNSFN